MVVNKMSIMVLKLSWAYNGSIKIQISSVSGMQSTYMRDSFDQYRLLKKYNNHYS